MRLIPCVAAALALAVGGAYADTTTSNKSKEVMERKASPSADKQDEERTQAHSQPDVPNAGGTTPRTTQKANPKSATSEKGKTPKKDSNAKKDKESSSTGASAPSSAVKPDKAEQDLAFKAFDLDGDGSISKAEAAGHADLMKVFDRADRDRDGRLTRAEYDNRDKPAPKRTKTASASAKR